MSRPGAEQDKDYIKAAILLEEAHNLLRQVAKRYERKSDSLIQQALIEEGLLGKRIYRPSSYDEYPPNSGGDRTAIERSYGNFYYDSQSLSITQTEIGSRRILTLQEDALLYAFVTNPEVLFEYDRLREVGVWTPETSVSAISVAMQGLRMKADEPVVPLAERKRGTKWKHFTTIKTQGIIFYPNGTPY